MHWSWSLCERCNKFSEAVTWRSSSVCVQGQPFLAMGGDTFIACLRHQLGVLSLFVKFETHIFIHFQVHLSISLWKINLWCHIELFNSVCFWLNIRSQYFSCFPNIDNLKKKCVEPKSQKCLHFCHICQTKWPFCPLFVAVEFSILMIPVNQFIV